MPNAAAHKAGAAAVVGVSVAWHQYMKEGHIDFRALAAAWLAGELGSLPDLLEPALHPNHRKFFHSFVALGLAAYGVKKLYDWQPESDDMRFWRGVALVAGGAFCVHLVMDSFTKRSLPLI